MVAEDEGDDEERNSEEDGDARDQVDEVVDFLCDGSLACVQTRGQTGDAAHYLNTPVSLYILNFCHSQPTLNRQTMKESYEIL